MPKITKLEKRQQDDLQKRCYREDECGQVVSQVKQSKIKTKN